MSESIIPPPEKNPDARKNLRAPLIVLKVKVEDGGKTFFGYARNISRSGMFIPATSPRNPGNRFLVELPLPAPVNRTVECTCEVVWARHYSRKSRYEPGMGLKFIDLPEEIAADIDAWVKQNEQP